MRKGEKVKEWIKAIDWFTLFAHTVSVIAVIASLALSIFYFRNVAHRSGQAFVDLKNSAVHLVQFFGWLLYDTEITTQPTVNVMPSDMKNILPVSWAEMKMFLFGYVKTVFSTETFSAYFLALSDILFWGSFFIVPVGAIVGLIALILYLIYSSVDNDYGKETKPKQAWLKVEDKFFRRIYGIFKSYVDFLKGSAGKPYRILLGLIWLYNLNFVTIIVEAVALYLYLLPTSDYVNLFVQIAKLGMDLTVALDFIPIGIWIVIVWSRFDKWRRAKGLEKLEDNENKNKKFLLEHPENLLATGEPRVGKTQAITDMSLTQEVIFREKAKELSFQRRMQFPFFHWGILEKTIRNMRELNPTFSLSYLREFIEELKEAHKLSGVNSYEENERLLRGFRNLGYAGGNNFIFNYDVVRFGKTYDNELKKIDIWESICFYAEEFYIYTNPTPLWFSNYPIKFHFAWEDYGNYPLLEIDFFSKSPDEIESTKQFSHLMIYDMMRLGIQKNPNGPYNNNYELGGATIAEIGKERGNQITNRGTKKDAQECNTANDLFEMDAKMRSHGTTIDYFTFFRILADEQRAMDLLAGLREIGSEMKICNKKEPKILMPGFAWEELIYQASTALTVKITDFITSRKGSEGLFFHLVMRVYSFIYNHYVRVYNRYSSYDVDLKIMNQAQGQTMTECAKYKYHISTKKVRSNVYDTGYFGVFYREKAKQSKTGGVNQVPQWKDVTPTIPQMVELGSHNFDAILAEMKIA